jgi:hypothetical protein
MMKRLTSTNDQTFAGAAIHGISNAPKREGGYIMRIIDVVTVLLMLVADVVVLR